jgi:type I restriction enzyme R subunit
MRGVGKAERVTQGRIVKLFIDQLGYTYLGNWQEREDNSCIEEAHLHKYLTRKGYSADLITRAIDRLVKAAGNQADKLFYVNKEVYTLLRYGAQVKEQIGDNNQTVSFINFADPYDNDFYIAEEVTIKGENNKRPDIVLYVNGIALGVLELKSSTTSVNKGIRQSLDNQTSTFVRSFFHPIQLIMAGNDTEGMKYGTIETKEKYYLAWKEDIKATDSLTQQVRHLVEQQEYLMDKQIVGMCHKQRFLELIHDFVVFDRGIKKLCRPNQYFGVRAAQDRVKRREGGIIWHAQGSGKSLTMVWLAKWIRENIPSSRILIITDRDELDKQIEKVFKGVDEDIYRTTSGRDLIEKLNATTPLLLNSLIHKFGRGEGELKESDYDKYIDELKQNLPRDFRAKGDIYVFVDECHRTQSGKLHEAMKHIVPNAMFMGFTGTPLLRKDKQQSIEIFGGYIHTYKFDEAVRDNVVLDLQYEARDVEQEITSQDKIDKWFEAKTRGLTDYAVVKLKERWGTMQKVLSSKSRLEKIVNDIIFDMETKDRLQNGRGNAMLVAGSIYEACRYYELFQTAGFKKCAIVTSYTPHVSDVKGETTGEDMDTDNITKYAIYQKMLGGKSPEEFEDQAKKQFVEEPAQLKLLIVVDKLLTGFDAPPATYLYIDKNMQDHGLFQAICRVNRLDGEDKQYGYIVDYKDLFKSLEKSVADYTSEVFADYDKEDIEGILIDRLEKSRERLDEALESLVALCEPVQAPKDTLAYIHYFVGKDSQDADEVKSNEHKRMALYRHVVAFLRAYANLANEMEEAGYTTAEIKRISEATRYYDKVRGEVMHAAGDYIELKAYEADMRHLIDSYISARESEKISAFDDFTLIDLIVARGVKAVDELPAGIKDEEEAVAETIENNVRRLITDETPTNPKYYEKMSVLLGEIIRERKSQVLSYKEYLDRIVELTKLAKDPAVSGEYPAKMNTGARRALYDNLGKDEELVLALDKDLREGIPDGWRNNRIKRRLVKNLISRHVSDEELVEHVLEIAENQGEYK